MEKTLKGRIKLLSYTSSEWNSKNPILFKGEVGIESDTSKFKFGDGESDWKTLSYAGVDASQLQELIDANRDNVYSVEAEEEQDDLEALNTVVETPKKGDIGVVKRVIADDKKTYTTYVYNGSTWEAADGSYDATNVYFGSDLVITAAIGVQTPDSSGSKTLPTTGKNVKQVFDLIVAQEKNPSVTQPAVTVSSSNMGAKEAGTKVAPQYTASLSAGSYQFGPATGVTATSWNITDTNGNKSTNATGTFAEFQVTDETNYSITAVAQHGNGAVPKTNLGNDYTAGQIKAGSKTGNKGSITGYRNSFYGTTASKDVPTDSDVVRGLAGKSNKALTNGATFNVSIPVGALRVIIAYPATLRDVTSILDVNGLNAEIKSGFTKTEVQVEGANGFDAIAYKVYTMDYAKANDTANTYKVTI